MRLGGETVCVSLSMCSRQSGDVSCVVCRVGGCILVGYGSVGWW